MDNKKQRDLRKANGNAYSRAYEKTKNGFLMRMYRNMQSRIEGIQKAKHHLYEGKELLPRGKFYGWAKCNETFDRLFNDWEKSGYDRKLTPSVDRIDSSKGYILSNMEWVTHSENSRRGSLNKPTRPVMQMTIDGQEIRLWDSMTHASDSINKPPSAICNVCKGNNKTAYGFRWAYA